MAGLAFKRKYRLLVTYTAITKTTIKPNYVTAFEYRDFVSDGTTVREVSESNTVAITELQMTADVRMDLTSEDSNEQSSIISIYNLSKETLSKVSIRGNKVILEAGYESDGDQMPMIFSGFVEKAVTRYSGTDRVTTLYCRAASGITSTVRTSVQIDEADDTSVSGKTYKDAFEKVIEGFKSNGLSVSETSINLDFSGNIQLKSPAETPLRGGFATDGYLRDSLSNLCSMFGFTWYIHKNILYVHPYRFKEFRDIYLLEPDAIKSLEPIEDQENKSTSDLNAISGVRLRVFLDGSIRPDMVIRVPKIPELAGAYDTGSFDLSGDYVVTKIMHELNFLGGGWDVVMECTSATKDSGNITNSGRYKTY